MPRPWTRLRLLTAGNTLTPGERFELVREGLATVTDVVVSEGGISAITFRTDSGRDGRVDYDPPRSRPHPE